MNKALKVYALATQLIVTLIICSVVGIWIGHKKDPDGNLSIILAGVGLFVGLLLDLIFVFQYLRFEAKHENRT